jgi:hypothetical protein
MPSSPKCLLDRRPDLKALYDFLAVPREDEQRIIDRDCESNRHHDSLLPPEPTAFSESKHRSVRMTPLDKLGALAHRGEGNNINTEGYWVHDNTKRYRDRCHDAEERRNQQPVQTRSEEKVLV